MKTATKTQSVGRQYDELPLSKIIPSLTESQARRRAKFTEAEIEELAQSITSNGLIQPITVRPHKANKFEIVAGERRYLAVKTAGFNTIDVIVRDLSNTQLLEIQTIENLQRKDVDLIDEAYSFKELLDLGYSITDLAIGVGF